MIRAPFNFVPLNDKVFCPEWAGQISQDIPFSDGVSGIIKLKITAKSPIFVRDGHGREENNNEDEEKIQEFCHTDDGRYFIPGTSIKGAVRNVLEIMSHSDINVDKNSRFAQREWGDKNIYTLFGEQNNLLCGWLKENPTHEEGKEYILKSCGRPYRISYRCLDDYFGKDIFHAKFSFEKNREKRKLDDDQKDACYKYKLTKDFRLDNLSFSKFENNSRRVEVDSDGSICGTIVFTGQPTFFKTERPDHLDPTAGKYYDFVFEDLENPTIYYLSRDEYNQYKFIYADSDDWKMWKNNKKGIPVFFRASKEPNKIKDLGLAFLYRLPYSKSVLDTLFANRQVMDKKLPDMAECIFGCTNFCNTKTAYALRGRVQFSPAFSDNAQCDEKVRLILNSPKASYYPIYIQQNTDAGGHVDGFNTYNDGVISGWKRYLLRDVTWNRATGNNKLDTIFIPLKEDTVFGCTIRFHNLKEVELGALISALTFHNTDGCFHQLGQAKPYGYGKVKYDIELINHAGKEFKSKDYYMALYQRLMTKEFPSWKTDLKELLVMSKVAVPANKSEDFNYMILDAQNRINEFVDAKGGSNKRGTKEALRRYSILCGKTVNIDTNGSISKIVNEETEKDNACRYQLFDTLKSDADALFNAKDYENALLKYIDANKLECEDLSASINNCKSEIENSKRNEFERLKQEAQNLYSRKDYVEALQKYNEANLLGFGYLSEQINLCKQKIDEQANSRAVSMGEYLKGIPLASTNAFANKLKVKVSANLSPEDVSAISEKLKNEVPALKKDVQKKWRDFKNWKEICKVIGEEVARNIFDQF